MVEDRWVYAAMCLTSIESSFSSMWHLPRLSKGHTQGRPKCALGWLQKLTHVPLVIAILLVIVSIQNLQNWVFGYIYIYISTFLGLALYTTDILGQNFTLYKLHRWTPLWSVGKCQKPYTSMKLHTARLHNWSRNKTVDAHTPSSTKHEKMH